MLYSTHLQTADTPEINIFQSGYARFDKDWKYRTMGNAFSRLYYIKKGHGKFISNGETITFRVAFKPTPTIAQKQMSVDASGMPCEVIGHGRHDPCVVHRAVPVIEAAAALAACELLGIG